MVVMLIAVMMMADTPVAAQPPVTIAPVAKKQKHPQVCEYLELTGSRSKRRVCHDADGNLDLGPGISNNLYGKGSLQSPGNGSSSASTSPQ